MSAHRKQHQSDFTITFEPGGQRVKSLPGETLLDCARRASVRISNVCGGRGLCKSCVIRVIDGPVPAPSEQDQEYFSSDDISANWRRACQTFLTGDCKVEVSARAQATPTRTQVESEDIYVHPDPVVRSFRITVPDATLEKPVADDNRLKNTLNAKWPGAGHRIDLAVQRSLPMTLRKTDGRVDAISRFGEIIGLVAPKKGPLLGLAVDIGTTNIGALLVDLRTGRTLKSQGLENPQSVHGADVITRMAHARRSPENLHDLHKLVIEGINKLARSLCEAHGLSPEFITDIVIVGNTTMHHMFMNLSVDQLAVVPFVPAASAAIDIKARELGIHSMPGAYVHLLPNIAGFVGADHTAVLLAISSDHEKQTVVVLDIGTNTEISLIHQGQLSSLSCPSGPALEGGHISSGMRSAAGAIEEVKIIGDEVRLKTIDDAPPLGICGSGVLDITAQLYLSGIVNAAGRMGTDHPRVQIRNGKREFVLADENEAQGKSVVFTQSDVRAVQLAKGAIRAGIAMLLENAGLQDEQLDQIVIAGAFGSYLNVASAVAIDMLPALPLDRFAQIGNAAGIGAKLALVSHPYRSEAQTIAASSDYLELAGSTHFNSVFMHSIGFPDYKKTRGIH